MKILFLSAQALPYPGGIYTYVSTIIPKLKEKGHEVSLLSSSDIPNILSLAQQKEFESYQRLVHQKLEGKIPLSFIGVECTKYALKLMLKNIDLEKFDIVHTQDGVSSSSVKAVCPSIPTIATLHGSFFSEYTTHLPGATELEKELVRRLDQQALQFPDRILTVSNYVDPGFQAFPYEKHDVVFNGIDTNFFTPKVKQNPLPIIATSGALTLVKGYDLFLQAIKQIKDDFSFHVFMYGDGGLKEDWFRYIQTNNLPVTLKGFVDRDTLRDELQKADLFVQPSRLETFGLSITEAMACGCVPIATDTGGIPDQITDGLNGILTQKENVDSIANALSFLLADELKRKEMSKSARETAINRFSLDTFADSLEKVYFKTLGTN